MNEPDPAFPYPVVTHVAVIRLDRSDYDTGRDVLDHLAEQARHIPETAVVAVHLGECALQLHPLDLERQIAGACYLAAAVDVHVPAGTPRAAFLTENVRTHVQVIREDHARMVSGTG